LDERATLGMPGDGYHLHVAASLTDFRGFGRRARGP
jgi:hypothetical protein